MKVCKRDRDGGIKKIDFYVAIGELRKIRIDFPVIHLQLGALICTPDAEYWMEDLTK